MREDLEELFTQEKTTKSTSKILFLLKKFWWLIILGVGAGLYVYFLIFGDNSWEVYSRLLEKKKQIEKQVVSLENENVELQKVIFELKGLEPNSEEKK